MKISASGEFAAKSSASGALRAPLELPRACVELPWKVTDISINPYNDDWSFNDRWSFNPSVHFDGKTWLCSLRTSNYAMPDGVEVKAPRSHMLVTRTRNVMLVLDPKTWKPIHVYKMEEHDGLKRAPQCTSHGFEDIRLFRTTRGGLQGICTSLQLSGVVGNIGEQVILSFDDQYNIVSAKPIRVHGLTRRVQKNWAPFDGVDEPRFLYSIDDSVVFTDKGALGDWGAPPVQVTAERPAAGATLNFDAPGVVLSSRHAHQPSRPVAAGGGTGGPGIATGDYYGLRGGSQLTRIADNTWLGIGHDGRYVGGIKIYCHTFYATDDTGLLVARSAPFRLRADGGGIEFAAGLAVDGDRVVISYGVDDMRAELAETSLEAVMAMLKPIGSAEADPSRPLLPCKSARRASVPIATTPAVVASSRVVDKPWGHEVIWAHTDKYVGKILHIKAGEALSLQYHRVKDETIMVLSGRLRLEHFVNGSESLGVEVLELQPGEPFHIAPHVRHRMTAIEDAAVLEVSTPELDDVVRIDDRYGRAGNP